MKNLQLVALSIELCSGKILHISALGEEGDDFTDPAACRESVLDMLKKHKIHPELVNRFFIHTISLKMARAMNRLKLR